MISESELAEMARRAAAATEGPWTACPQNMYIFGGDGHMVAELRGDGAEDAGQRRLGEHARNAAFIAAAREDVQRLVAELERVQALHAERMAELQDKLEEQSRRQRLLRPIHRMAPELSELGVDAQATERAADPYWEAAKWVRAQSERLRCPRCGALPAMQVDNGHKIKLVASCRCA